MFSLVTCGPLGIVWPIESVLYPANANDVVIFKKDLLTHLPSETKLLLADTGFDDQRLANACDKRKITLVTPISKVGKSTPKKRLARAALFSSSYSSQVLDDRQEQSWLERPLNRIKRIPPMQPTRIHHAPNRSEQLRTPQ